MVVVVVVIEYLHSEPARPHCGQRLRIRVRLGLGIKRQKSGSEWINSTFGCSQGTSPRWRSGGRVRPESLAELVDPLQLDVLVAPHDLGKLCDLDRRGQALRAEVRQYGIEGAAVLIG